MLLNRMDRVFTELIIYGGNSREEIMIQYCKSDYQGNSNNSNLTIHRRGLGYLSTENLNNGRNENEHEEILYFYS
jgi:hypothetical protein